MDVERLGVADVVAAPDPVDQRVAGQHPPGVGQQHVEQLELLERQRQRLAGDGDRVLVGVERHVADRDRRRAELAGVVAGRPAQHGPHPGHELAQPVRLGDVVVGADLEPTTVSISAPLAVTMMIGTWLRLRSCRQTSMPLIRGSITSSRTRSGFTTSKRSSASKPSVATSTWNPSRRSPIVRASTKLGLVLDDQHRRRRSRTRLIVSRAACVRH